MRHHTHRARPGDEVATALDLLKKAADSARVCRNAASRADQERDDRANDTFTSRRSHHFALRDEGQ
jgi:hypothetical protein